LKSRQGLAMLCGKGCEIVLFSVPGPDKKVVVPVNDFWMNEITSSLLIIAGLPILLKG
jgi:hypothetical protein